MNEVYTKSEWTNKKCLKKLQQKFVIIQNFTLAEESELWTNKFLYLNTDQTFIPFLPVPLKFPSTYHAGC